MAALRVLEIFDSLQGEGCWTGVPMTFVRLAGCNAPALGLGCVTWCDTPDSWDQTGGEEMGADAVMECVHLPRLCITGGEPLLQIDGVVALVGRSHERGVLVHLETNGTIDPPTSMRRRPRVAGVGSPCRSKADVGPRFDWVVVSPKPPTYAVAPGWGGSIDELKLVVGSDAEASEALAAAGERLAADHQEAVVSVQPEYGAGQASVNRAVALVMNHPKWRLSLQTHKLLGIR